MTASTDTRIADALRRYLEAQLRDRPAPRAFFRISDFSPATYSALLDDLQRREWRLAGRWLAVRTIDTIPGHDEQVVEDDRSPTWYRNALAAEHALVLIQNRRTTDAQSLQDIYPVTALTLSTTGLAELIDACFDGYQLSADERGRLSAFVYRLSRVLYQPQLRDLTDFLAAVKAHLTDRAGTSLDEAITEALPYLGLFRCHDLRGQLQTARGDKLLRQLRDAARIRSEVLDDATRNKYLSRLESAALDDDKDLGGVSASQKRALLRRFIDGQLRDQRAELLQVLQIDWREIQQVITTKSRVTQQEKLAGLGKRLDATLGGTGQEDEDLREVLANLEQGEEPDASTVDRLLASRGDALTRPLRNELRRLVKTRTRSHADFLVGLTALAVELTMPHRSELTGPARLRVVPRLKDADSKHLPHALLVFQMLYRGIEQAIPSVSWELDDIWRRVEAQASESTEEEEDEPERERVIKLDIPFRISLLAPNGTEIAQAQLNWQYRSDSPASATAQTLLAERAQLRGPDLGPLFSDSHQRLRIPVYNNCPTSNEIGDLDIHRPIQALGAWFEQPRSLRKLLEEAMRGRGRPATQAALSTALDTLEAAWAALVVDATDQGLFAADIRRLLTAYEQLLHTATAQLQSGQEVAAGYRVLNQAWMIGPPDFPWAVMPLLHPLKLLWWWERARYIHRLVGRLLDPSQPAAIVDEPRYLRELGATYGSSQFPPLIALPPGEGRSADRLLPAEEAQGYELYLREGVSAETFGLDADLLAEDENEKATHRAAEGIAAVVQDYIETYPFVRDGLEIVLFECRDGSLPGLLIERLAHISQRQGWKVRISVIVHTSSRGAPLFRRVSEWMQSERPYVQRQGSAYFPLVSLKVVEAPYGELLRSYEDTDIVILADVLTDKGQEIASDLSSDDVKDVPLDGYLPTYRAQQEPFQRGETERHLLLTSPEQPAVVRYFLLAQHAAVERRPVRPDQEARFYRNLTIQDWERVLRDLHQHFNWVICYDPTIDRFLMESAFPEQVQIIRYSLGLGAKRQHNLTVSSSGRAQEVVVRRLASRLEQMFHRATPTFLQEVAWQLITKAKEVSGDIVLRAAGPGAFLNELIGLVVARFLTERRLRAAYPDALISWVLLDDFEHWFSGGKFPDLLAVAIAPGRDGGLVVHAEVLEAKCVGQNSFEAEALDAQRQVLQGVGRLARAFAAGGQHLDALYWYDQLYRAVIGNLQVDLEQQALWERFRARLYHGDFRFTIEGHSWAFCYDGQVTEGEEPAEHGFDRPAEELTAVPLRAHHYGRSALSRALRELVEASGSQGYAPELWEPRPTEPAPAVAAVSLEPEGETPTPTIPEPPPAPPPAPSDPPATPAALSEPADTATPPVPAPSDLSVTPVTPLEPADTAAPPAPAAPSVPQPDQRWLEEKARDLQHALRQRGIQVFPIDPGQADVGPSIVRFKLRLRSTESLKNIQRIAEDLARDLALPSTPIIDNVLRTNFVGIDIPREQAAVIPLLPLLQALGTPGTAELPIIIGISPEGTLVTEDLSEFPHLLVAGATNSGKSVFLRSLLLSLLTQYQPGTLELLIIDPKRTDFTFFNNLPYLRGGKVIIERNEARDALLELVRSEMPRRQDLIANRSLKIKDFNRRYPQEALPPVVALIDEYALLTSMMDKKERETFEQDLMILATAARSVGIHLVLATQRPSADIVTSPLKANLDARVAFKVASNVNSRVVLDTTGAENLLGRGDLLFRRPSGEIVRLQAPFMDEVRMQEYLSHLQQRRG